MYNVLTGKQRSLVFPVMCNAHVKIDYSDNVPKGADGISGTGGDDDDVPYGIFGHDESFTIEATVTPYDINGYGGHTLGTTPPTVPNSEKIMPALSHSQWLAKDNHPSDKYLTRTDRFGYEMAIFHSSKVQLYLVNTTLHSENQPAEYKIRFKVDINGTTVTLDSPTVFSAVWGDSVAWGTLASADGFEDTGKVKYKKLDQVTAHTAGTKIVTFGSNIEDTFHADQEIYLLNGFGVTLIDKIASVTGTQIVLTNNYATSLTGSYIYLPTTKHPSYINNFSHIAATFNDVSREMKIYYNNRLVASTFHTDLDSAFAFAKEDYFLGANGGKTTGEDSAKTNKQFMGELHEFAISGVANTAFNVFNLTPRYANTLLYFRFEEVDE